MILAGDIGGTKTVLALISPEQGVERPLRETTFRSTRYNSLESMIGEFLADIDENPAGASFGVAGPVKNGQAEITNLAWSVIDAISIQQNMGIPRVHLLNDLEAIATAVPHLRAKDLVTLNQGQSDPTGAIAVIAPGTGLGEAYLVWDGQRHRAYPSEGGHVSYAPGSKRELELLVYLWPKFGHVSYERVCSGSGIPNIYDYLRDSGRYKEPIWLQQELTTVDDRTPIIVNAALESKSKICTAALKLFVKVLAGEVGNMALNVLSTGGVYLGGGIPPRIVPWLQKPSFLKAFQSKGRFKELLAQMPVHVIMDPKIALHGAAYDGLEEFVAAENRA